MSSDQLRLLGAAFVKLQFVECGWVLVTHFPLVIVIVLFVSNFEFEV